MVSYYDVIRLLETAVYITTYHPTNLFRDLYDHFLPFTEKRHTTKYYELCMYMYYVRYVPNTGSNQLAQIDPSMDP